MNYLEFLNKEVINKENEKGVVVSFDDINIKIRYFDKEKIYSTKISLKNKYLRFLDEKLNNIIEEEFKEKETHKVERTNHEIISFSLNLKEIKKYIVSLFIRIWN